MLLPLLMQIDYMLGPLPGSSSSKKKRQWGGRVHENTESLVPVREPVFDITPVEIQDVELKIDGVKQIIAKAESEDEVAILLAIAHLNE